MNFLQKLEALEKLERAATFEPWSTLHDNNGLHVVQTAHGTRDVWYIPLADVDSELIAESRNALPKLLRDMRRMYEALRFYSDSYTYGQGNGVSWSDCTISKDMGERARQVLKGLE